MSIYEQTGGTFSDINGYLIPDLMTADSTSIGKWGRMRKRYLKEQHPILFSELLLSEQLYVMELLEKRYHQQKEQCKTAQEAWLGWKTEAEHSKALVFTNLFGEHLHPQTVYNHFKKLAAEIGAPNAKVHDLRHPTRCSRCRTETM